MGILADVKSGLAVKSLAKVVKEVGAEIVDRELGGVQELVNRYGVEYLEVARAAANCWEDQLDYWVVYILGNKKFGSPTHEECVVLCRFYEGLIS